MSVYKDLFLSRFKENGCTFAIAISPMAVCSVQVCRRNMAAPHRESRRRQRDSTQHIKELKEPFTFLDLAFKNLFLSLRGLVCAVLLPPLIGQPLIRTVRSCALPRIRTGCPFVNKAPEMSSSSKPMTMFAMLAKQLIPETRNEVSMNAPCTMQLSQLTEPAITTCRLPGCHRLLQPLVPVAPSPVGFRSFLIKSVLHP
jgi:hypothetical protein